MSSVYHIACATDLWKTRQNHQMLHKAECCQCWQYGDHQWARSECRLMRPILGKQTIKLERMTTLQFCMFMFLVRCTTTNIWWRNHSCIVHLHLHVHKSGYVRQKTLTSCFFSLVLPPLSVAEAAYALAEGSCSCFSVTAHNFLASSASCACTDGVAILQSARYAPDLPFSSGAVAAYTEVAAPYIAWKVVEQDKMLHFSRLSMLFQSAYTDVAAPWSVCHAVSGLIRARAKMFDMIKEATANVLVELCNTVTSVVNQQMAHCPQTLCWLSHTCLTQLLHIKAHLSKTTDQHTAPCQSQ